MMKKLLISMLVFAMASLTTAGVIDVVVLGEGSLGNAGTSTDPLEFSETIEIGIVLNHNPYPGYPDYDGYLLSSIDLDLHVSGAGSMDVLNRNKLGEPLYAVHPGLSPWSIGDDGEIANGLDQFTGVALTPIQGPATLLGELIIHCDGPGPILIDLTLLGLSDYSTYSDPQGQPYPGEWLPLTEEDLGDLVIHNVPEPLTITLLGIGGLLLRRRR
jgi:hypothetical protein